MRGARLGLGFSGGGGGAAAPALPSGATHLLYAADYTASPRKTIPNRMASGSIAADQNLLSAPRRMFNLVGPWAVQFGAGTTITDNNASGPDSSGDATTVVTTGVTDWQFRISNNTIALPAGTYTMALSARSVSGSADFRMGDANVLKAVKTATASWARYTQTFVTAGTVFPIIQAPAVLAAASLEFCDVELFSGSSDLHPTLTDAPNSVRRSDLMLGKSNVDSAISVSGGYLIHGGVHALQFLSAFPIAAFTVVYISKKAAAPSTAGYDPILAAATLTTPHRIEVGSSGGAGSGSLDWYNGTRQSSFNSLANQIFPDLNYRIGDGAYCSATVYDGTTLSSYMNGVKTQRSTLAAGSATVKDFWVGLLSGSFLSGQDIAAIAIWPRALTTTEVVAARAAMLSDTAISLPANTLLACFGTSLTAGLGGKSWTYDFTANAVKAMHGVNGGQSGANLPTIITNIRAFLNELNSAPYPAQTIVVTIEWGTNDLNSITAGDTAACDAVLATLASVCDDLRTAGVKVAVMTTLSRSDQPAGAKTSLDTNRAYTNPILRTWVGTGTGKHIDAVIDMDTDPTVGGNTAPDNLTNYPDRAHPTAAFQLSNWEPIVRAAVNPLL